MTELMNMKDICIYVDVSFHLKLKLLCEDQMLHL